MSEEVEFSQSLPCIFVSGSHYDVGFEIGKTFRTRICEYLATQKTAEQTLSTETAKETYAECLSVAEARFPQYVREVRGMADGAGVSIQQLWCQNLRNELRSYQDNTQPPSTDTEEVHDCSTIILNYQGQRAIVHNEDLLTDVKDTSFMVRAHVTDAREDGTHYEEKFWAFCYPGQLPGPAFGANCHGLMFSMNGIYPKLTPRNKTPRTCLNRAVLGARSQEDLLEILTDEGSGLGHAFSLNYAWVSETPPRLGNIEAGPSLKEARSVLDVLEVAEGTPDCEQPRGTYYHFNTYDSSRGRDHEQTYQPSSIHRRKAALAHPLARSLEGALTILGDETDKDYPIFRTDRATEQNRCTIATAVLDAGRRTLSIYRGNPARAVRPVFTTSLAVW